MLRLNKITLTHFKNYDFTSFTFNKNVVGISGLNGRGKTNLLDAIYYCCFTKSYFSNTDALNINLNKDGFRLEAGFELTGDEQKVICIHRGTYKKEFSLNDISYEKYSKHIGLLPAVMIAPDDSEIITGSSEGRRKYIDTILCQVDSEYLQQLMIYNKVLLQRNSLLKKFAETGNTDEPLLEILDEQFIIPARYVHHKRATFLPKIIESAKVFYKTISGKDDDVSLAYESQMNTMPIEKLLQQNRIKDKIMQRTTAGIHRDDIELKMNGLLFKNIASQGQRKSLLFALKLAEYEMIKQVKNFAPLLLLDDVFEKLDNERIQNLLHWVCLQNDGQVFITDTNAERLDKIFTTLNISYQLAQL
ncbi:MAG: DNA replication and repair protein RecF [Ferruginibacter sp.]